MYWVQSVLYSSTTFLYYTTHSENSLPNYHQDCKLSLKCPVPHIGQCGLNKLNWKDICRHACVKCPLF